MAIEHALLHGPAARTIEPRDAPALRNDVQLLRDFFLARDSMGVPQGLSIIHVDEATRALTALLVLLASPSELLVRMWESAADHTPPPNSGATEDAPLADGSEGRPTTSPLALPGTDGAEDAADATPRLSDKQRIARVLTHRSDTHARSWRSRGTGGAASAGAGAGGMATVAPAPSDAQSLRARFGSWMRESSLGYEDL